MTNHYTYVEPTCPNCGAIRCRPGDSAVIAFAGDSYRCGTPVDSSAPCPVVPSTMAGVGATWHADDPREHRESLSRIIVANPFTNEVGSCDVLTLGLGDGLSRDHWDVTGFVDIGADVEWPNHLRWTEWPCPE